MVEIHKLLFAGVNDLIKGYHNHKDCSMLKYDYTVEFGLGTNFYGKNIDSKAKDILRGIPYEFSDIQAFVDEHVNSFDLNDKGVNDWVGLYLSVGINNIIEADNEFTLDLTRVKEPLNGVGFELPRGKLTVLGNVGNYFGSYMSSGKQILHLKGAHGDKRGHKRTGGNIIVEADGVQTIYLMKPGSGWGSKPSEIKQEIPIES